MKFLFLALACLAGALGARAQSAPAPAYDPTHRYAVAELQADLAYVRRALEEAHPALYWYTPKDSLDRAFDRTAAALTQPLTEPEYWRLLQTLVTRVRCGHTRVQHSPAYRAWFRQQPHSYLPFLVTVQNLLNTPYQVDILAPGAPATAGAPATVAYPFQGNADRVAVINQTYRAYYLAGLRFRF